MSILGFHETELGRALFSVAHAVEQIRLLVSETQPSTDSSRQVSLLAETALSSVRVLIDRIQAEQDDLNCTRRRLRDALQHVQAVQVQALALQNEAKSSVEQLSDYVYPDDKMIY
ncbi:hypothetical protein BX589_10211 [Paraburkholderia fungorum]|jgi:hypothetical protein|uniref:hypothetical protein n=1 Tax=Paraburkholderia fungorum TaxID=134537 RepID=UPI000D4D015F|nr:hypothetical protein [Paraburkholderia fungorum]PRZ55816.1 hypothetical protein BX589_10211 [Paraburkholderia fungorum]